MTPSADRWQTLALALLLIAVFTAGLGVILYATDIAPWAYSDSAAYLTAASNLAGGRGLTVPDTRGETTLLSLHPPLFPVLLSLPISLGVDGLQAARWLNAILFGLFCALTIWSARRFSRSLALSALAGLLPLFSPDLVRLFCGAMSEGTFLVSGFLGLTLLAEYLLTPVRRGRLVLAGLLIGLATLARYAGAALIIAGLLGLLLIHAGRGKKLLATDPAIFAAGAVLPPLSWVSYAYVQTGSIGGRNAAAAGDLARVLQHYAQIFYENLIRWLPFITRGNRFLPVPLKLVLGGLLLAAALFILVKQVKKHGLSAQVRAPWIWSVLLGLFILGYLAFHLASILFSDTPADVDWRLLTPTLAAGYFLLPMLFAAYARLVRRAWLVNGLFLLTTIIVVWYYQGNTISYIKQMHSEGAGYTSLRWRGNEVFPRIRSLDPTLALMSNDPGLVLFYTGAYPILIDMQSAEPLELAPAGRNAYLILFLPQVEELNGADANQWIENIRKVASPIYRASQAEILQYNPANKR